MDGSGGKGGGDCVPGGGHQDVSIEEWSEVYGGYIGSPYLPSDPSMPMGWYGAVLDSKSLIGNGVRPSWD